jgi:hypothetical protein
MLMSCAQAKEMMERIAISVDETPAKEFDALIGKRGYASRSGPSPVPGSR